MDEIEIDTAEDVGRTAQATIRRSRPERIALFLSWALAKATWRKKGLRGAERTAVIVTLNRWNLGTSVVLTGVVIAWSRNDLSAMQWNAQNDDPIFLALTSVLASYCMSRVIEVLFAFCRDAFAKLADEEPESDLDGRRRIGLALTSYLELILNFGLLMALVPCTGWQTGTGSPALVTDVLFYSASTITTSGGGGFVPAGMTVQWLTLLEIACGLILLVVCFAVYAGNPRGRPTNVP
jgi:voltage-gated potassium channel